MRVEQRYNDDTDWSLVSYEGVLALAAKLGVPYNMDLLNSGEFDTFFVDDFNAIRTNMSTNTTWYVRVLNDDNEVVYENSVKGECVQCRY